MKQKITISLLMVSLSLFMFQPASAVQASVRPELANYAEGSSIFVDVSNNSGVEDGTELNPFNTIQEGINLAMAGDMVVVAPGTYYENVILKTGVKLVGADATNTIIDGGGSGIVVTMENASTLSEFTIQNGRGSFGAGIVTRGTTTIMNNIIRNNAQTAGGAGAAIYGNSSSPRIFGNLIYGNTADNQWLSGAVSFVNSSSPYIINNIIRNNSGRGAINLTVPEGNGPVVMHNTILSNSGAGIKVQSHVSQDTIRVINNIVMGNTTGILIDSLDPAFLSGFQYNDIFGNAANFVGMSDITGTNGNISADPLFADEFHLGYGSPLVDAGSATEYETFDFDQDPRPLDGNGDGVYVADIGADERVYVDDIPPVITASATSEDGTPYKADTWTNQAVTVHFTCSDGESGIAHCPADQVFSEEGITELATATATDNAGNSATATFGPIKIDKTPPALFVAVSPNPVLLNGSAQLLANAADELSGIKPGSMPCFSIHTDTVGFKTTECRVSDYAGNQTIAPAEYQVIYDFDGFLAPLIDCVNNACDPYNLSFFNVGSPVSLKFRLKDANGAIVQPATAPIWLQPLKIDAIPPISFPENHEFQTTNLSYTWKRSMNMWVYDWSTKKLPARTTWLVGVKLDDGKTYYVFIALK